MHHECEYCIRRKYCTKPEPKEDESCEDYDQDNNLFDDDNDCIAEEEKEDINKILSDLEWNLRARLNHLEFIKYTPIDLHNAIEDIIADEINKVKIHCL